MNWFDNVSSNRDQPIAAARLVQGHWLHRLSPYTDPVLCRVVLDVAEPRVVAAQVIEPGQLEDLGLSELEDLTAAMLAQEVHLQPAAWGLARCATLPAWAHPSFNEDQIAELERIEGYLVEASEDTIESVLQLRDEFLRGIGMADHDICRAARPPQHGQGYRKGSRLTN